MKSERILWTFFTHTHRGESMGFEKFILGEKRENLESDPSN